MNDRRRSGIAKLVPNDRCVGRSRRPGCPKINTCIVDVQDVADLHLRAMTDPKAAGERFLATSGQSLWMVEIARLLKDRLGPVAAKVSTRASQPAHQDDRADQPSDEGDRATARRPARREWRKMLDWDPRSPEDAILASVESLVRLGLVENGAG